MSEIVNVTSIKHFTDGVRAVYQQTKEQLIKQDSEYNKLLISISYFDVLQYSKANNLSLPDAYKGICTDIAYLLSINEEPLMNKDSNTKSEGLKVPPLFNKFLNKDRVLCIPNIDEDFDEEKEAGWKGAGAAYHDEGHTPRF